MEDNKPDLVKVDPDPIAITGVLIAGASLVLSMIEAYKKRDREPVEQKLNRVALEQIESAVEDLEFKFAKITRTIERGSASVDKEFLDAPFGIAESSILLDQSSFSNFTRNLSEFYLSVATLSTWANNTISNHPDSAMLIGRNLLVELEGSSDAINKLIRSGGRNREIIAECRLILTCLHTCVTALINTKSN